VTIPIPILPLISPPVHFLGWATNCRIFQRLTWNRKCQRTVFGFCANDMCLSKPSVGTNCQGWDGAKGLGWRRINLGATKRKRLFFSLGKFHLYWILRRSVWDVEWFRTMAICGMVELIRKYARNLWVSDSENGPGNSYFLICLLPSIEMCQVAWAHKAPWWFLLMEKGRTHLKLGYQTLTTNRISRKQNKNPNQTKQKAALKKAIQEWAARRALRPQKIQETTRRAIT